ncbi:dienelactone hydrolase [Tricladium varicosporioides]|nr:dienelactone hydrolase [Hymenoscyphus varicosporioides]
MSCPACYEGTLHTGTPTGRVESIHGLPTYIASPPDGLKPRGIIIFIPDIFGWEFPNNRLLADSYAKKGQLLVYLPDFMAGRSVERCVPPIIERVRSPQPWLTTIFYKPAWVAQILYHAIPFIIRNRQANFQPRVYNFITALRTSPPPYETDDLKISAAGFCWGGYYTVLLCQNSPDTRVKRHKSQKDSETALPLIDCGYTAHPSMLKVPKDIQPIELPICISIGEEDQQMSGPNVLITKEILEKKDGGHEVNIIPGAKHGFSVRLDPKDEFQAACAARAEEQALTFFGKYLS